VQLTPQRSLDASLINLGHFHHRIGKKLLRTQLRLAGRTFMKLRRVTNQKSQKIIIQHQEYLQQKEGLNNAKTI